MCLTIHNCGHTILNDAINSFSLQVTTHGHLLQREELERVAESVHMRVEAFLLQEFDTELDFSNKVGYVSIHH